MNVGAETAGVARRGIVIKSFVKLEETVSDFSQSRAIREKRVFTKDPGDFVHSHHRIE